MFPRAESFADAGGGLGGHHPRKTLDVVVIYLNPKRTPALAFMAIARMRKRSDLFLTFAALDAHQDQHRPFEMRLAEEARLAELASYVLL